jgi:transcriptional regulator with GAF, ATPase, and Fis domain
MYKTIIIIALCLFGIFVHPFNPGVVDFIYRFIIFSIIVYLLYTSYQQQDETTDGPDESVRVSPVQVRDQMGITEDWHIKELIKNDNRTLDFLKDQFDILTNMIFPDNGWIFYTEGDKILVIHHKKYTDQAISDEYDSFPITGLIQILNDKNDILIENNLERAKNLIPYYKDSEYSAASFMGLPVVLRDNEKVFFVFDSHHTEHFNKDDISLFNKLKENTAIWILNRIKAYALLNEIKEIQKLLSFAKDLNSCKTVNIAIEKFSDLISNEFEASRLTISIRQRNENQAVIKKVIGQRDEFEENVSFPLDEGLTGWIISKNKPYLIEDLEKGEYFIPRYNKKEKSNLGLRSFLGVPIEADDQVFGSVSLEHRLANKYNETDKKRIKHFVDILSTTFLRSTTKKA